MVIKSASVGGNAEVFPSVLHLHVPKGSTVADVTFGRGVFWKQVDPEAYTVLATDLSTGVDCTKLPYDDNSVDAVVLDPPYVAGFFRPHKVGKAYGDFTHRYSRGANPDKSPRYHAGVLDLFNRAAVEAYRVLQPRGVFIVKCQDEVHAGKQYLTHVELVQQFEPLFTVKDLFIVMRTGGNFGSRGRATGKPQQHARKNHSYFMVFIRRG